MISEAKCMGQSVEQELLWSVTLLTHHGPLLITLPLISLLHHVLILLISHTNSFACVLEIFSRHLAPHICCKVAQDADSS
jgi:hypothetical protein